MAALRRVPFSWTIEKIGASVSRKWITAGTGTPRHQDALR